MPRHRWRCGDSGGGGTGRLARETWQRVLTRIPAGTGSPAQPRWEHWELGWGQGRAAWGPWCRHPTDWHPERAGTWGRNRSWPGAAGETWPHPDQHGLIFVPERGMLRVLQNGWMVGTTGTGGVAGTVVTTGWWGQRERQCHRPRLDAPADTSPSHQDPRGRAPRTQGPPHATGVAETCGTRSQRALRHDAHPTGTGFGPATVGSPQQRRPRGPFRSRWPRRGEDGGGSARPFFHAHTA